MPLTAQPQVQAPPAGLIERFYEPTLRVAYVWHLLSLRGVPIVLTSWWRPPERNLATAGAEAYSQHLVGTAIDALSPNLSRAQLLALVQPVARALGVTAPPDPSSGSGRSVHVQGLPAGTVRTLLVRDPTLVQRAQAFIGPARPVGV